ncbi:hypothetical protein TBLA_0B07300 [Henningerozyma blattae CBS 6284]|uniref:UDP-N-acetylglucosamine diphosphorylase n=1 Tax=Henningerozyma blattae (strain ATCC 34711 / CBS 6284 / DSM 70876 / NBRC 10599 / NRRL Y-10934 / UCD 77-7) TaxID=1071380 RepID=I2GZJ6_HENB6|nr:hypothetical protein TBLA_0B07300 [Tetrapisispora blattae CBS 6284]CCH59548.1 hypothetical protein TBLA_0B07300 [Tetrapisispora blattae CBS 6284]
MTKEQITIELFQELNQTNIIDHLRSLNDEKKSQFLANLNQLNERISLKKLLKDSKESLNQLNINKITPSTSVIDSLPSTSYQSIIDNKQLQDAYYEIGIDSIKKGEVAVILMAGGQGTRLGSSNPKGCFDIGLPSHKSLFQIQAERLISLQNLANSDIPIHWYIMTSPLTSEPTQSFFEKNNFFGLSKDQITFFNQGTLPALDPKGEQFLIGSPTTLVESPDGNGGLYRALRDNHLIEDFVNRGIKHIHMYCVDNILTKLADPVFIGFAIKNNYQLATKSVRKRSPHESVGVIATRDSKPCVIEYSEISNQLAESIDKETGLLKLRAANIVNHYYSVDLLKSHVDNWCNNLTYHIANKKIPIYDSKTDSIIKFETPNGIKLEQFIFDIFPLIPIEKFGCLEVDRNEEFSPLKNASGTQNDNPETSRLAYLRLTTNWLKDAGAIIKDDDILVEVSSKLSYHGENLSKYNGHIFDKESLIEN